MGHCRILLNRMRTLLLMAMGIFGRKSTAIQSPSDVSTIGETPGNNVSNHFNIIEQGLSFLRAGPRPGCMCQQQQAPRVSYRQRQRPNTRMMIRLRREQMNQEKEEMTTRLRRAICLATSSICCDPCPMCT